MCRNLYFRVFLKKKKDIVIHFWKLFPAENCMNEPKLHIQFYGIKISPAKSFSDKRIIHTLVPFSAMASPVPPLFNIPCDLVRPLRPRLPPPLPRGYLQDIPLYPNLLFRFHPLFPGTQVEVMLQFLFKSFLREQNCLLTLASRTILG